MLVLLYQPRLLGKSYTYFMSIFLLNNKMINNKEKYLINLLKIESKQ